MPLANNTKFIPLDQLTCTKICRICLKTSTDSLHIFSILDIYKKSYADLVMEIAPVIISEKSPSTAASICKSCREMLIDVLNFRQLCIKSDAVIVNQIKKELRNAEENLDLNVFSECGIKSEINNYDTRIVENCNITNENGSDIECFDIGKDSNIIENSKYENSAHKNNNNTVFCEICGIFCKVQSYYYHKKCHLKEFSCSTCGKNFPLYFNLKNHLERKECDKEKKRTLTDDLMEVHTVNSNQCKTCNRTYKSKRRLRIHIQIKHSGRIYPCDLCNKTFSSRGNLLRHGKDVHLGLKNYKCELCDKQYAQKSTLNIHLASHSGNRVKSDLNYNYSCNYCDKKFMLKHKLVEHERIHTETRPYSCQICDKTFRVKCNLLTHKKRCHTNVDLSRDDSNTCKICSKVLDSFYLLKRHMQLIHSKCLPTDKVKCDKCGKLLKSQSRLELHKKYAHGNYSTQCSACGKYFSTVVELERHQLIHEGAKPHKCSFCEKTFRQDTHLRQHIRIHTGEKPFKCEFCPKAFRMHGALIVHTRIHTGERPYKCSICGKGFYHLTNQKKHVLNHA